MVRLPPGSFLIPFRGIALKGHFYSREVNGRLYIARWPKSQKRSRTSAEADNRKLIAQAASITKYMSAQEQQFSREIAAATKLSARDLLMISLFNRLGTVILLDGRKIFTMAAIQDVSRILDSLGQTPGDMLYRGDTWWTAIPIGDEGQLMVVGPDGFPEWQDAPLAPSSGQPFMAPQFLKPTTAAATFNPDFFTAYPVMASLPTTITGLKVPVRATGASRTIVAGIYEDNAGALGGGTLLAQSTAIAAANGVLALPFSAPVNLSADRYYYIGLVIKGGSGNVQFTTSDVTKNDYSYFSQASTTLPATAPAATTGTGATQFTWWGY